MAEQSQLERIAKELFWWQPPEVSLADTRRFITQVMTLGTLEDIRAVQKVFGWNAFKQALLGAEAGEFDARSWDYWRAFFGLPEAEMPQRSLT